MCKTLGLDMSSNSSAFSLFENRTLVEYGLWKIPEDIKEWRNKILWMGEQLNDYISKHEIDRIYCEDVPLIMANPQTLKILSALQGMVLGVVSSNGMKVEFIGVSKWRSDIGLFTGDKKDMGREEMKKSSIEYSNNKFGLNLVWKSKSSKFNQDDISDAINVAWSQIQEKKQVEKKKFKI